MRVLIYLFYFYLFSIYKNERLKAEMNRMETELVAVKDQAHKAALAKYQV